MAAAREAEQRWREGRPLSDLDGVPITIKENIHTRGDPTPGGTPVGNQAAQERDAPPSARAREAGCVIVGKTTMPDYGMLSSGLSSLHGLTRNPWRLDRNTSGSSSGAGAACAAGYGPLHIGTDIGGSVRLPATHCGVFALKPSLGRIPIDPPYLGRAAGPMTRTVRDAAALLTVLSQPDVRDFMSLPYQPVDYAAGVEGLGARGLRIGLITDFGRRSRGRPRGSCRHRGRRRGTGRGRRRGRTGAAVPDRRDARRHLPLLRGTLVQRRLGARWIAARPAAAVHRRVVHVASKRLQWSRRDGRVQPGGGDAGGGDAGSIGLRLPADADLSDPAVRGRARRRPATIRTTPCRTSRSPSRGT